MAYPLQASQENVARAKRKFTDLNGAINRHLQDKPFSLRIEKASGLTHIIACRDKDIDIDTSFDVVDIVLRLRAALDKAVVAMVSANQRGTSGVGFPFGGVDRNTGRPNEFPDPRMTRKDGLEKKLSPEGWRFLCAQRPHPGGNDILWAINEIANTDKHREGLVTVSPSLIQEFKMGNGYIDVLKFNPTEFQHLLRDEERETVLLSAGQAASQANVQHSISISVIFCNGFGVDGRNVLATLNEQIRITEHILKGISSLL